MQLKSLLVGLTVVLATTLPVWAQENRVDSIRPDAPALAKYGTFGVGVRTARFIHANQVDVLKAKAGEPLPHYDRPLTVEMWYPSKAVPEGPGAGEYRVVSRDPKREVTLRGKAVRDAAPDGSQGPYPLVLISHGYPGNRFLMTPLAENLASKGYVVASIDHTDSTYSDQAAFASTLLNRPLDQLFVLREMAALNAGNSADALGGVLKGMVNADATGLIGYSMGGYGAINTVGGGFTAASVTSTLAPPNNALAVRQAGNPAYTASLDPRIKAVIAIAPWGWRTGFWDAEGLSGIKTPLFFMAGGIDDVAGYAPGVRNIFEASVNAPRYLLTFDNANHNAAAPMPAPKESWTPIANLPVIPAMHYIDPVWDNVRMNNIAQHFATAFLARHLRADTGMDAYLALVESSKDGKWSMQADGTPQADHTYWKGFANRTAVGLRLESRKP